MERLNSRRKKGINGNTLRTWGLLFAAAGIIGRGVIQTHMLGIGQLNAQQLLEVIGSSDQAMNLATISLILQAIETCAVPVFALLLTEGFQHTSDRKAYFIRVAGLALACEIPYNLAIGGKLLDFGSRNPVFGLVMCMVMLMLYGLYAEPKLSHKLIKFIVTIAAVLWCGMLKIEFGAAMVVVTATMWALRRNVLYRNFAGAAAAIVCTVFSPFFLASPMGFMAVHFYDGERNEDSRTANYLYYPAMLVCAAVAGFLL